MKKLLTKDKNLNQACHRAFKWLMALFIVLIPWQTRWIFYDLTLDGQVWQYGRLSIYASMLVLLVGTAFFGLAFKKQFYFSKNKFLYFLFFYSLLVAFLSQVPAVSFYYLLLIYLALLFAYLAKFLKKEFVFQALFASGFVQAVLALWQMCNQQVIANKWLGLASHFPAELGTSVIELGSDRILRAYGALPHPNILGGFLFVSIFAGLYLWFEFYKKSQRHKWSAKFLLKNIWYYIYLMSGILLMSFALLGSFSRSAVLALVLTIFSLLVISILKRKWLAVHALAKYSILFVVMILVFNAWWPGVWASRFDASSRLEQKSVSERIDTLDQLGWDSYKNAFIGQGLGINTYQAYYQHQPTAPYDVQPIHNIFILALAEVGLLGVLLLLNIVRLIVKSANQVDIMSTSLIMGLVIIGMFDHYLWTSWTGWLLLAFSLVNLYRQENFK